MRTKCTQLLLGKVPRLLLVGEAEASSEENAHPCTTVPRAQWGMQVLLVRGVGIDEGVRQNTTAVRKYLRLYLQVCY